VAVPVAALALAARVSVLDDADAVGLKLAVTPVGRPDAENVTFPVKPLIGETVIVLVPLLPCTTVSAVGLGDNEKFFADGFTVRPIVIVWLKLPDVPVTLISAVPVAAVALAANVRVVADEVASGLNEAVTPLGNPEAAKVTLARKPFDAAILIELVTLSPCKTVRLAGVAASVKTAGQLLTRLKAFTLPIPVAKSHPVVAG